MVTAHRITKEIEEAVTHSYSGWGVLTAAFGLGRMFIELPYPTQRVELEQRVNWAGLTTAEKDEVIGRVLSDVRQKTPEEIFPATWFDTVLIAVDPSAKVYELGSVRQALDDFRRDQSLYERVTPLRTGC